MTPAEVRAYRQALGMTQADLASALRLASDGKRTVRHWETEGGKFSITGPASVALELLVDARRVAEKSV
jgi:DNA-binding transcriptional regulator YiaG